MTDTACGPAKLARHVPEALGESASPNVADLARAAFDQRIVIYAGAGLSIAPPACGPSGWAVSERLRPDVAEILGVEEACIEDLGLEALAERVAVEAPGEMQHLKELAATAFNFRGLEPNYGHEVLALLLREGLFEVVTVNWDCGVESAGLDAAVAIVGVATAQQRLQLGTELPLYKLHGCAKRPETLALTQSEVDAPQTWALSEVQSALMGGHVVFLGLGTVGLYVAEPIKQVASLWVLNGTTVHIVDPSLSAAWKDALGSYAEQSYYRAFADDFLDELLRSIVLEALHRAEKRARVLAEHEAWGSAMTDGVKQIIASSKVVAGDAFLRWWRDGVARTEAGKPFIADLRGQRAIMTVGLLVASEGHAVTSYGPLGRMTLSDENWYYEIACHPGEHFSDVDRLARARIERRNTEGVYADGRPITVVVVDAFGKIPAWDAPGDIAGMNLDPHDISGFAGQPVRFIAAEDGVRGLLQK